MTYAEIARDVTRELDRTLSAIAPRDVEQLVAVITGAQRVFIAGAGRSGLAVRAFAMRLMHMGRATFVVGEMVTPAMMPGDLLVIGSGSGGTASLVKMVEKAKSLGARVALVTIVPDSASGRLADVIVRIPAPTPKAEAARQFSSIQPMGTLFEQSLLVFLDIVVLMLMEATAVTSATMFERHANLE